MPALLEEFAEQGATEEQTVDRQTELMEVLGSIDDPLAVETITKFAVGSPREAVRYAAIDQLAAKPHHEYVPMLLAEMKLPIEASVSIYEVGNEIISSYSYGQEGPGEQEHEHNYQSSRTIPGNRYFAVPMYRRRTIPPQLLREGYHVPEVTHPAFMCGGHMVPERTVPAYDVGPVYSSPRTVWDHVGNRYGENPGFRAKKQQVFQRSKAEAAHVNRQIDEFNQAIARQNEQIADVLAEVTGETLDTFPKSWWNWWSDYLDQHPDLAASGARQQLNSALLNQAPRGLARGTWIWTLRGLQPVEVLRPGDYVLAQDPKSGELAYQTVLAVAAPQELSVSKLDFDTGSIHCAPGHIVWRSGSGWRRVSKIEAHDMLHGVEKEPRLEQTGDAFSIDCYDLIVDEFHTYFVGESGILVHDATRIQPTFVALPGFSPADVANASRLAAAIDR